MAKFGSLPKGTSTLRPLGGRYGNAFSVTGVLKHDYKHPMHLTLAGGRL